MMPAPQAPASTMHPWQNIPAELRDRPQWCWASLRLWDAVDADGTPKREKKPLDPKVPGQVDARTNDPTTWGTFEQAAARAFHEGGGIGFVVMQSDPYVCVDLDAHGTAEQSAEHQEIIAFFARAGAYVETSTRGKGSHVWMRRASPLGPNLVKGANHATPLEIYDRAHFLITTGNGAPVARLPELDWQVRSLYEQFAAPVPFGGPDGAPVGFFEQGAATVEDEALIARCRAWDRKGLFEALHDVGDITAYRGDASAADLAYWSHLVFCARNGSAGEPVDFAQCDRIYQSARIATHRQGQYPRKAHRKAYVWSTFVRAMRDHTAMTSQAVAAFVQGGAQPAPETQEGPARAPTEDERAEVAPEVQSAPPGLVGEIAQWVLASAFIPLPNLAILVALCAAAGVVGRSFKTPFNDPIMLQSVYIAPTGGGKEHAKKAMNDLFRALKQHCPAAMDFVGPSRFKSGQALRRVINKRKCMVSVADEFGEKMAQVWSAKSDKDAWTEELLAMFGGTDDQGTAAADEKNDVIALDRPAFTLLALTNGEAWFPLLDNKRIFTGVLPRMIAIDDSGVIADPVRNRAESVPEDLLVRLASVCNAVIANNANAGEAIRTHTETTALADDMWAFILACRRKHEPGSVGHALSTRIAQNAIRVATILAVLDFNGGAFGQRPVVCDHHWQWAKTYVGKAYAWQIERYTTGDMGTGDSKRAADVAAVITAYRGLTPAQRSTLGISAACFDAGVITRRFFDKKLRSTAFTKDPDKEQLARTNAIKGAVDAGLLRPLPAQEKTAHKLRGDAWLILGA